MNGRPNADMLLADLTFISMINIGHQPKQNLILRCGVEAGPDPPVYRDSTDGRDALPVDSFEILQSIDIRE